MATKAEIIAEAKRMTPPGGDYVETLYNYVKENNIPFEQVDQVLELPPGSTASYAASKAPVVPAAPSIENLDYNQVYKDAITYANANPGKSVEDYIQGAGTAAGFSQADIDAVKVAAPKGTLIEGSYDYTGATGTIPKGVTTNTMLTGQGVTTPDTPVDRPMTVEEIVAEAQRRTPVGGDYRDTLLQYIQNENIPFDQADTILGLPTGSVAAYAASKQTNTNANAGASVGYTDVINNLTGATERSMLTQGNVPITQILRPLTQASPGTVPVLRPQPGQRVDNQVYLSPEQKSGIKEYFTEIGRLAETGVDIGPIVDKRRQELGLSYNQLADIYTQTMGTDPSFIRTGINQYLTGQGQQPVDFAQGMMRSTGFQSPVPSDISNLFNAVQDVRNINQGYLSAPRTDLAAMRRTLEGQYATQDKAAMDAAIEAQKKSLVTSLSGNNGSEGNFQLSPQVAAYLDSLSPEERDQRMRELSQMITPGFVTALNNQFGTYNSSYGTSTANSSLSNEAKAGLAAAQTSFGYGSDKNFYGD